MGRLELFPREHVAGVFRGFREGGLEFHADLVLPYRDDFQSSPMHGQFLLVQLETPDEAVLGRITSFSSEGKLALGSGEDYAIRAMQESRGVPDDLRKQYLKYRVDIRILGVARVSPTGKLTFVASHRRLPHVGSYVGFPSDAVLREIVGHSETGAIIGHLALGEYVYAANASSFQTHEWMQLKDPEILVRFPIHNLVSRRSFIFARAGFGKSNLNKLLFSKLYEIPPTVQKRNRDVPVGTIIFDPDGEYFWPDDKGRPGLCDVPNMHEHLVVFTSRKGPSPFYQSFVAGGSKLDLRRFKAADVISVALSPDRQEQQNVRKLAGLNATKWEQLVELIAKEHNQASLDEIASILDLDAGRQEAEALAARANMTSIVRSLHDPASRLIDLLIAALIEGKLCVVDVSQMRGNQALIVSGLILRWIFERNQREFTEAEPKTIPTIAVIEEAQSVLHERATTAEPYIAWVKEGRKYDLGAVLITQQPGSIPTEILSQGDNWFIFHLLSAVDLANLRKANAHFSEDLLSVLLNEPIPGQGVFWSSVNGKAYPIPLRTLSFEDLYTVRDPHYTCGPEDTYAARLRKSYEQKGKTLLDLTAETAVHERPQRQAPVIPEDNEETSPDYYDIARRRAIESLRNDSDFMRKMSSSDGLPWGGIKARLVETLPDLFEAEERSNIAYQLVARALDEIFGPQRQAWTSYRNPRTGQTWARLLQPSNNPPNFDDVPF